MSPWKEELELVEKAALRIQDLERNAESAFDRAWAAAEARNDTTLALRAPEFEAWMAARRDSDAAWGRWFEVMNARPRGE